MPVPPTSPPPPQAAGPSLSPHGVASGRRVAAYQRLYINIDHVATVRQARRTDEPDPVEAATVCEDAGADGITAHLREDRRHVQDDDVERLARVVRTLFNLEIAASPTMVDIALRLRPRQVTLVPERREEITTEGGLDLSRAPGAVGAAVDALRAAGIRASLFIDPDERAVRAARAIGAEAIELHTGRYARHPRDPATLGALDGAARLGADLGLAVHAGHGLTARNVAPLSAVHEIEELNIGHSIVSRAIFVGLAESVREMRRVMDAARAPLGAGEPPAAAR